MAFQKKKSLDLEKKMLTSGIEPLILSYHDLINQ